MRFSNKELATYLFCAPLPATKTTALTILEWNATVKSLAQQQLDPEFLLSCSPSELMHVLTEAKPAQKTKILTKVEQRQKLGIAILELEEAINQGYQIVFRPQMPKRLKKLDLAQRPAFYYYIGDLAILQAERALSVVGARDALPEELSATQAICEEAAKKDVLVISGGARGVDTAAVDAALQAGGKAVIFPSEGLSSWSRKKEARNYIQNGQLLLLSTQPLDAKFSGIYAMQRNKFIHATSDATLVASSKISGQKKSGTWEGVLENVKHKWSALYTIGQSEGVEQLKLAQHAEEFTSLENVFAAPLHPKEILANEIEKLIHFATLANLQNETIREVVQHALEKLADSPKDSPSKPVDEPTPKKQLNLFNDL